PAAGRRGGGRGDSRGPRGLCRICAEMLRMQRTGASSGVYYADNAPPPPEPPVRGRLWRVLGVVSVVLSVVLVAGCLTAYGFWRRLDGQIDREDVDGRLGQNRPPKLNSSLNILLIGSDSRAGENARYGA